MEEKRTVRVYRYKDIHPRSAERMFYLFYGALDECCISLEDQWHMDMNPSISLLTTNQKDKSSYRLHIHDYNLPKLLNIPPALFEDSSIFGQKIDDLPNTPLVSNWQDLSLFKRIHSISPDSFLLDQYLTKKNVPPDSKDFYSTIPYLEAYNRCAILDSFVRKKHPEDPFRRIKIKPEEKKLFNTIYGAEVDSNTILSHKNQYDYFDYTPSQSKVFILEKMFPKNTTDKQDRNIAYATLVFEQSKNQEGITQFMPSTVLFSHKRMLSPYYKIHVHTNTPNKPVKNKTDDNNTKEDPFIYF